ncbi:hypothetical protein [Marinomonas atlantica]|uniref:hypothetical protein n=1 Tax=Marinomonas atlantica TaxID=1806668 RepID=UPI0008319459|nr:hypothetical protein [Marinomonas atlantica]
MSLVTNKQFFVLVGLGLAGSYLAYRAATGSIKAVGEAAEGAATDTVDFFFGDVIEFGQSLWGHVDNLFETTGVYETPDVFDINYRSQVPSDWSEEQYIQWKAKVQSGDMINPYPSKI